MRLLLILALVSVAGCGSPSPTISSPSGSADQPSILAPTAEPSPKRTTTPDGWMEPPCTADLVIGGDFVGEVHGPLRSTNRHTPSDLRGVIIDAILAVEGSAGKTSFHLGIIDVDGPGPKPVSLLFNQEEPELLMAHGWEGGRDGGTANIANDGSGATLDVTFPTGDASGGTPGTHYTLQGTISCPPLSGASDGSS